MTDAKTQNRGMIVYFFVNIKKVKIGSISAYKIAKLREREWGTPSTKPVEFCDISDFDGELHNAEWMG